MNHSRHTARLGLALVAASCLALGGCSSLFKTTCAQPQDYAGAVDNKPLQVPAGLQGPDTRSALPVPPLNEPERPRTATDPCLDAPPKYATQGAAPPSA